MHTTILATKVGMTQVYDDDGNVQPVTVLEVGPCKVELLRTQEREGYSALQMSLERKGKTVARRESRIEPEARQYEVGEQLDTPFMEVETTLLMESQEGHDGFAQFLCEARADIDKPVNNAGTPLLMASQHGHAELAQLLCGARADIDKQFNDGATSLLMAVIIKGSDTLSNVT